eukprot:CAMPEP_0201570882 /NCGR_PEP_ID=MMETSP0190_2-20130828/13334_1 /ASSEMBLY_ACC=CAM_ASM_000263 /TAXON_ID=37353 /ORGANISM="Rosalina sp." /LENGTH=138 /DNA_ID=CAMNT_0047994901 /DNA_START=22 /DNA_END=435 /DNA_ORIENTATION=-
MSSGSEVDSDDLAIPRKYICGSCKAIGEHWIWNCDLHPMLENENLEEIYDTISTRKSICGIPISSFPNDILMSISRLSTERTEECTNSKCKSECDQIAHANYEDRYEYEFNMENENEIPEQYDDSGVFYHEEYAEYLW